MAPRPAAVRLCAAVALAVAAMLTLTGAARGLDDGLLTLRGSLLMHPATGRVVLAEIDAASLHEYARWPWPRRLHARAIDALNRAGAAQIAFDVDFSAASTPSDDAALAAAIARSAAPVILPTFRQTRSLNSDRLVENLPLAAFRKQAMLGSVEIAPDDDGLVRSMLSGVVTDGTARPSVAALLAGAGGTVGRQVPIDRGINAGSVPRLSMTDLLAGRVPAGSLRGKSVLIGATAIEIGDRYATAERAVLPGALIQVLAAETMLQGRAPVDRGPWLGLGLLALLTAHAAMRRRLPSWRGLAAGAVALLLAPLGVELARLGTVAIGPALGGLMALGFMATLLRAWEAVRVGRLYDGETDLPNAAALRASPAMPGRDVVTVLRIGNFTDLQAALGPVDTGRLLLRVVERLGVGVTATLHRVEPGALAWLAAVPDAMAHEEHATAMAALCNLPFEIDGRSVRVLPVLGGAPVERDVGEALAAAQASAETAQAQGLRWLRHSASAAEERDWRLALAAELDGAMADGSIWLAYQPKLDLATGRISAVEALVRWSHRERGAIAPDRLIGLLEDIGRIDEFTLFVLDRALSDMAQWLSQGHDIGVAVNVSAQSPSQPGFVAAVARVTGRHPEAAGRLTLEITESAVLADAGQAVAALEKLAAMGIRISIDDYGTGQSTLAYLKGLPASEIKIDKSFVTGLAESRSDQLLVESTIHLAHGLGYKVVGEGVETAEVRDMLASYGCDTVQGWHTGRPMPLRQLIAFMDNADQRRAA
ncbi:MAG: EAL domain-containing protein [Sphingomonadales bacterium]|nr:EAL domain-containing protein [Sphingomonadales bacterium]